MTILCHQVVHILAMQGGFIIKKISVIHYFQIVREKEKYLIKFIIHSWKTFNKLGQGENFLI